MDWKPGEKIRLMSCRTGYYIDGAAKNLANKLGVDVKAPTERLWVFENGGLLIGEDQRFYTGKWVIFTPGK